MNNKILVGVVIVLLLLGGGWYLMSNQKTSGTNLSNESTNTEEQSSGGVNSLKDLLTAGVSQTCTFSTSDDTYNSEGKVYVASGKMRGDFATTIDGVEQKSHMVVKDNTSFIWTDGQKQGYKATFEGEQEVAVEDVEGQDAKTVDINQKVDYKCSPGIVSDSYFDLPSDVEFLSLGDMMKGTLPENSDACSACDSLTGETKTQCLAALDCN